MKEYPSILTVKIGGIPKDNYCLAFDKIDGSSLRFEWSKKSWLPKYGTRTRLFDETDEVFGPAINLFQQTWAEPIAKYLIDHKIQKAFAYAEFFGPNSFAGTHEPEDTKQLAFFDLWIHQKGFVSPQDFVKTFGHLAIPKVIHEGKLNQQFVNDVEDGKYDVVEGVVCKHGDSWKNQWMRKIKTKSYLEKLKKYGKEE